jgi:site-specific DNA-methyltransferase (adenine-specific)
MDNMAFMAGKPDNYYELAIVDPPYRDSEDNQPTKDMRNNGTMDNFGSKPTQEYFKELFRVSKNQIIWGANNFTLPNYKGFVIWKKKTISENFTMSMCELAFISEELGTTSKWIEIQPQSPNRIHPTQKPIKLYEWLLENYASKGDKILDTHGGSMSSVIACINMEFDMDCMELDKDYFESATNRVQHHASQLDMFREQPTINIHTEN